MSAGGILAFPVLSAVAALLLVAAHPAGCHSLPLHLRTSAISAAPAFLPSVPLFPSSAPAFAPDAMPVLPTPGAGAAAPPATGALPTIPSSPSPPNPDELQPNSAVTPAGSAALTSPAPSAAGPTAAVVCGLVLMWWWLELAGK